jgi:hypothetical protein
VNNGLTRTSNKIPPPHPFPLPFSPQRLVLDAKKLSDLGKGLDDVVSLPEPLGSVSLARELSPGLELRRVSCPIGVLCVIFEARPEAVVQIASLAIKSGNAVILKGGKEAQNSNKVLVDVIRGALASLPADARVSQDCVQFVSSRDEVASLLQLDTYIDVSEEETPGHGQSSIGARTLASLVSSGPVSPHSSVPLHSSSPSPLPHFRAARHPPRLQQARQRHQGGHTHPRPRARGRHLRRVRGRRRGPRRRRVRRRRQ